MKYIVILNYDEYEFDDGTTALSWAEIAAAKKSKQIRPVTINIVPDKGGDDNAVD